MNIRRKQSHHREVSSAEAIAAARAAFSKRDFILHSGNVEADFMELGLLTVEERSSAVDDALSQISPQNRLGPRSPKNIAYPPYGGEILYAFNWKSSTHGSIYFKFCLAGPNRDLLIVHSFHVERDKDEK